MKLTNKLKWVGLALVGIMVFGCSEEEAPSLSEDPVQLSSIRTSYGAVDNPTVYTQTFLYDTDERLNEIQDTREGEGFQRVSYDDEGKLDSLIYESASDMFIRFKDFDFDGDMLVSYSDNHIGGVIGVRKYAQEYKYSNNGLLEEVLYENMFNTSLTTTNSDEYEWNDGNVETIKSFDQDGNISIMVEFSYDDKKNFAYNNPMLEGQFPIRSKNNVIRSVTTDFTGLFDPVCLECTTEYTYTSDGYPKTIKYEWGSEVEIEYQ